MAGNVNQKNQTLNEIIDWCEQLTAEGLRLASALLMHHDMNAYGVVRGQINAYEKTADHCRSMLAHTGNTPTETPNQNKDTPPQDPSNNTGEAANVHTLENSDDGPETTHNPEESEHEHRKTWNENHTPGRKDQEHDPPQHTSENPYKETKRRNQPCSTNP